METGSVNVLDWVGAKRTFLGSLCWIVGPGSARGIPWPQVRRDVIFACDDGIDHFVGQGVEYDNLWWLWDVPAVFDARREALRARWRRWAVITGRKNVEHVRRNVVAPTDVLPHDGFGCTHDMTALEVALRAGQWLGFRRFIVVGYSFRDSDLSRKIARLGKPGSGGHLFEYCRIYCLGKSACKIVQSVSASSALEMRGVARDRVG